MSKKEEFETLQAQNIELMKKVEELTNRLEKTDFTDEEIDGHFEKYNLDKFIVTKTYKGRRVAVYTTQDGNINLRIYSKHLTGKDGKKRGMSELTLSPETFALMMEVIKKAQSEFSLNTQKVLETICEGKQLEFSNEINLWML